MKKLIVIGLLILAGQAFAASPKKYDHAGRMEYHARVLESILSDAERSTLYEVGEFTCLPGGRDFAPRCSENWYKVAQHSYTVIVLEDGQTITVHEYGQDAVDDALGLDGLIFENLVHAWTSSFNSIDTSFKSSYCSDSKAAKPGWCAPSPKLGELAPDGAAAEFRYRLGKLRHGIQEIEIQGLEGSGPGAYRVSAAKMRQ
jgi:hypothetical protein